MTSWRNTTTSPCRVGKVGDVIKLIPNLGNKTNYVLRNINLQSYLSLGIKLTKIHKAVRINKSNWVKFFIDFNTKKRKNAANSFQKGFFKLMIKKSVYDKTMENLRKRISVEIVNNDKNDLKHTSNQLFFLRKSLIKFMLLFMKLNQF